MLRTWQALITMRSSGVVDTLHAIASRSVTISHRIRVYVSVAVASLTQLYATLYPSGVPEETISARFTTLSEISHGTLQANNGIICHRHAGAVIGTRAALTIVLGSAKSMSIETTGALVARVPRRVVLTNTPSCLRVAYVSVLVAVAWHTGHEGTAVSGTVPISRGTRLAELADITLRTAALLHPVGCGSRGTPLGCLQLDIVQVGLSNLSV